MKLTVKTNYNCEPLFVTKLDKSYSRATCDANNVKVGKAIFKWMRSKAPAEVYYSFMHEYHLYQANVGYNVSTALRVGKSINKPTTANPMTCSR